MINIKVKDNEGNVYSTDMTETNVITAIHFCTSYTTFEVQEEYLTDDGKKYKHKDIIVPINKPLDLEYVLDLMAVKDEEIGEII